MRVRVAIASIVTVLGLSLISAQAAASGPSVHIARESFDFTVPDFTANIPGPAPVAMLAQPVPTGDLALYTWLAAIQANPLWHSDAWWMGVAQCEQGGRNDPFFGYFSFMNGSQGGRPWADQVLAGNLLLTRVGHEVGPWAASCVASGYRASPGG